MFLFRTINQLCWPKVLIINLCKSGLYQRLALCHQHNVCCQSTKRWLQYRSPLLAMHPGRTLSNTGWTKAGKRHIPVSIFSDSSLLNLNCTVWYQYRFSIPNSFRGYRQIRHSYFALALKIPPMVSIAYDITGLTHSFYITHYSPFGSHIFICSNYINQLSCSHCFSCYFISKPFNFVSSLLHILWISLVLNHDRISQVNSFAVLSILWNIYIHRYLHNESFCYLLKPIKEPSFLRWSLLN